MPKEKTIYHNILEEKFQGHETRVQLYDDLEKELEMPVVSFFTSFVYPVMIQDGDADMLETVLHKTDMTRGFTLLINSPGGDGLAAERVINICRAHSKTGEYVVIVPAKAKSAATMIALGASKIVMSKTSELGPIDPQIAYPKEGKVFSVYNIVKSYEELFAKAVKTKGNLEPYIQQLQNYDSREIEEFRFALGLSKDIAIKALRTGMMSRCAPSRIEKRIGHFIQPEKAKDHGRAIYANDAMKCGLKVDVVDIDCPLWKKINELYIRLDNRVSSGRISKVIESGSHSFNQPWRGDEDGEDSGEERSARESSRV
ncbi:MAG: hypothetical protein NT137_07255 [Methanomassiliicoccales archaeon]|nr:hypothetical protein [Methanomassiliicoccales archaeon]